jgi:LacI family xylobiose transport system transcriptional regulator
MPRLTNSDAHGRRVTLEAVAKEAKVSPSTVSKVLNGRAGVSEQTRRQVEEGLARCGYVARVAPNASRVIEVVFYELGTGWILEALQGIEEIAREMGCTIMLTKSHDLLDPERGWADQVSRRRPLGVILLFSSISDIDMRRFRNRGIPFVVLDPARQPGQDVPYVGAQNWAGGVAAAQHLIELGHKSIAVITGPERQLCARADRKSVV